MLISKNSWHSLGHLCDNLNSNLRNTIPYFL